jgi:hypothetical protein
MHVEGIDFTSFQEEFDLDRYLRIGEEPKNNFFSVAEAVNRKYPNIIFRRMEFAPHLSNEKLKQIEEHIEKKHPVLVSISNAAFGGKGWHIMPVVDATKSSLVFLQNVNKDGSLDLLELEKDRIKEIHERYPGGNDIAFLESW